MSTSDPWPPTIAGQVRTALVGRPLRDRFYLYLQGTHERGYERADLPNELVRLQRDRLVVRVSVLGTAREDEYGMCVFAGYRDDLPQLRAELELAAEAICGHDGHLTLNGFAGQDNSPRDKPSMLYPPEMGILGGGFSIGECSWFSAEVVRAVPRLAVTEFLGGLFRPEPGGGGSVWICHRADHSQLSEAVLARLADELTVLFEEVPWPITKLPVDDHPEAPVLPLAPFSGGVEVAVSGRDCSFVVQWRRTTVPKAVRAACAEIVEDWFDTLGEPPTHGIRMSARPVKTEMRWHVDLGWFNPHERADDLDRLVRRLSAVAGIRRDLAALRFEDES